MDTSPIKVVQSLAGAPFGGAENLYTRLTCALTRFPDLQPHAFTRENTQRLQQLRAASVPTQTFRFGGKLDFLDHFRYRKALKNLNPDIVLTFMNRASSLTPNGDYQLVSRLGHYYDLKNYRHADYWIGITKGICDHLVQGGMPANRVIQIPNFADESEVTAVPRDSFNTPENSPVLLAAGRLHINKGFDVLLRSLKEIPDVTLWLAGDGPEREKLHTLAQELRVYERVRFLGWRNDVASLMRSADLFVCPSRHEGLGSIVVESWFHQCPIVATNSQGPGELIEHGTNGLVTPVDNPAALSSAIKDILSSSEMAKKLAANAKKHYNNHFSQLTVSTQYHDFFRSISHRNC
jgi:glycosyltransferase involved in cell wall biosynthesis